VREKEANRRKKKKKKLKGNITVTPMTFSLYILLIYLLLFRKNMAASLSYFGKETISELSYDNNNNK